MRIPKSFKLGGVTWTVEQINPLIGAMGVTHMGKGLIQIDNQYSQQIKEQVFLHEAIHAILFAMGKPGSEHDEVFVDGFATFLHQLLTTAK